METYPVDLEASQIVRWLIDEKRRGTLAFAVSAARSYVQEDFERADLSRFSDEDVIDLNDCLAVGTLEVRPAGAAEGWVLKVRVEDRLGPRLPEDEDAPEDEEEIDIETFETDFIRPDPDAAEVFVEAETADSMAKFTSLLDLMLRNRHAR